MSGRPQISWLPGGSRLHLNQGPIDLIVEAFGADAERRAAYASAVARFDGLLEELVAELAELRRPAMPGAPRRFAGRVAQRMESAVQPFSEMFVTPMAAVAGAVADEVQSAMLHAARLERAYVNNGGDIALHLAPGHSLALAIAGTGRGLGDRLRIDHAMPARGIATSGWRGRSHSLGIADAVTVLAPSAAQADAAATMIANSVDLPGHPAIARRPACTLAPDSDLGERLVTVAVGHLDGNDVETALTRGLRVAEDCVAKGLVAGAALFLGGMAKIAGEDALLAGPPAPATRPGAARASAALR